MKKIVLFVAVISAISFASCKKDRVCTCVALGITEIKTYTKAKKGDARAACLSKTYSFTTGSVTTTVTETCTLK